jgi:SAM-dependent methyltransferase
MTPETSQVRVAILDFQSRIGPGRRFLRGPVLQHAAVTDSSEPSSADPKAAYAKTQHEALATLNLRPGDRFLDVGCGSGAAVHEAARVAEHAVGVDLSPKMISRAIELASGCTASFHHYPNPAAAP